MRSSESLRADGAERKPRKGETPVELINSDRLLSTHLFKRQYAITFVIDEERLSSFSRSRITILDAARCIAFNRTIVDSMKIIKNDGQCHFKSVLKLWRESAKKQSYLEEENNASISHNYIIIIVSNPSILQHAFRENFIVLIDVSFFYDFYSDRKLIWKRRNILHLLPTSIVILMCICNFKNCVIARIERKSTNVSFDK